MRISFSGVDELSTYIRSIQSYIQHPKQTFAKARVIMLQDVMDHFKNEMSPEGSWTKLADITVLKRRNKKESSIKILQDTGRLKNSITTQSGDAFAEVGTNVVYGATHQFGRNNIPKREFIWLSQEACERIRTQFILDMKAI